MKPSFLNGRPIVAEDSWSSTAAAPELSMFGFSPRIKVGEAKIFAFSLVILASNQLINLPFDNPPEIILGTLAPVGFAGSSLAVIKPKPLLLIILVSPVLSSKILSFISDLVKETSIIFMVNATCLCLTSKILYIFLQFS